jgi:hypothetical protein
MSPGTLLSMLRALPHPHEAGNSSEPLKNGTTSGAPLRREVEIIEAPCTRNEKTASGMPEDGDFGAMLHKWHAIVIRNSKLDAGQGLSAWNWVTCNLLLAARARVGHIRHNGAVAEWLKAAVC